MYSTRIHPILDMALARLSDVPDQPCVLTYRLQSELFGLSYRGGPSGAAPDFGPDRPLAIAQLDAKAVSDAISLNKDEELERAIRDYAYIVNLASSPLTLLDLHAMSVKAVNDTTDESPEPAPEPLTQPDPPEYQTPPPDNTTDDGGIGGGLPPDDPTGASDATPEPLT